MEERLQRYLARCGVASRRKAEQLILDGRVQVDGCTITKLGSKVDPSRQRVTVDGVPVEPEEPVVVMLNKPVGYVSSVEDEPPYPSVLRLVQIPQRIYPVGRLDVPSRGLLLLTNRGDLYHQVAHPRHHLPKRYRVVVGGRVGREALSVLGKGMEVEGERYGPMEAKVLSFKSGTTTLEMVLREGRKRQIRRSLAQFGLKVLDLQRISIGPLSLRDLPEGRWRFLQEEEVDALISACSASNT
jgi:23S rRNA pseudouridine2605 synthase